MSREVVVTAYDFEELNENLQLQIKEQVAGRLLVQYMNNEIKEQDLKFKIRVAVEADNYKLIKHGIMIHAWEYVENLCKSYLYLSDGTIIK